mgnify:CR=1 FL=1
MLVMHSENPLTKGKNISMKHPGLAVTAACLLLAIQGSFAQQREFGRGHDFGLGVIVGEPTGIVNGAIHINDTQSAQARADLLTAYNNLKNLPPGTTISAGADLGALYPGPAGIPPGTYTSGSTMLVSTPLILNAGGNANAVWVFQIGSSLTTGADVTLTGGAQQKNVYWVPTLDATIGVGTTFHGTIVSGRDVTAVTGAIINGRILAGATTAGTIALQGAVVNVPAP